MILAAGRGKRMGPLTINTPKPLLEFRGKPLIVWHIEKLAAAGFEEIVINISYLAEKIRDYLGDGSRWGVKIIFSEESPVLETAGGIKKALPYFTSNPFLVINSDIFSEIDYSVLKELNFPQNVEGLLIFVDNPDHNLQGDFFLDQKGVVENYGKEKKTFAGIALYRPIFFEELPSNQFIKLSPLLKAKVDKKLINGQLYKGLWKDIGTPERLISHNNL